MSFTIIQLPGSSTATLPTIHLTPSKQRPITRQSVDDISHRTKHTVKELTSWSHRADATAPCRVRDILKMDLKSRDNFEDVHWLGNVPCRNVKLVGMIVGIQVYERRILYTLDDGTGVIDCTHRQQIPAVKTKHDDPKSKYKMPEKSQLPLILEPIAVIGQLIQVIGSVHPFHDSMTIKAQYLAICSSTNDELHHARTVRELHRNLYSKSDPFVIPNLILQPLFGSPTKSTPQIPNRVRHSPQSSVSSSPIKDNCNLPITHDAPHRTIIKLRHPSRLHTHDLTENTFRIYVKHYIDCIQEPQRCGYDSNAIVIGSTTQLPSTPTKQSRFDETPRASTRHDTHITPRQRIPLPIFGTRGAENISLELPPSSQAPTTTRRGVTLSYLRRVPELSLLAARVTEAVARRRTRAERKRLQEAGLLQKGRPLPPSDNADKQGPRMKRLFQFAIIQLLKEGNITLWDGPVRRCPDTSIMNISRLWKSNTSTSTDGGDSTVFGSTYSSIPSFLEDDNDEGTLSDPDANEEAYISLTPEYFSEYVEDAIKVLVDYYQRIGKPYAGATREGILQVLRKDDQWRRVGTWTIDDALEYLKVEGRVWNMGKGRWDLTE